MGKNISTRKSLTTNKVSHSNIKTKSRQKVNLQNYTIDGVKVRLSTREARTLNKWFYSNKFL